MWNESYEFAKIGKFINSNNEKSISVLFAKIFMQINYNKKRKSHISWHRALKLLLYTVCTLKLCYGILQVFTKCIRYWLFIARTPVTRNNTIFAYKILFKKLTKKMFDIQKGSVNYSQLNVYVNKQQFACVNYLKNYYMKFCNFFKTYNSGNLDGHGSGRGAGELGRCRVQHLNILRNIYLKRCWGTWQMPCPTPEYIQ